ncbi:ABC transporter permease [Lentilactobacillus kisonensis]|uniref:ABC-2 type transporter n=2 Tax=Lentilactobacillus kisonensis TaxID=481722 RepID=H1LFH4_9LACO|nr:ABC transporter permease [Lentilactobacillus kisonensis]EHO51799.1 hypothetical protein HMPREF9104_01350 [Lentilactobacillus kisonensis F0435]KRL22055.1 hypothetical protein FC98_GL000352 [Lentilactobacillus kisonensis DSM 19906 = JCM 15041]
MKNSLKQEFFKFSHQRIPLYGVIALFVLMLYSAVSKSGVSRGIVAQGFGAGQWVTIIMITIASTFMAMEYQNRTIMTLFYKSSHKAYIYTAKMLVIILYGLALMVLSFLITVIFKALFVGNRYQWTTSFKHSDLINALLMSLTGSFIYILFIVTLAFFLISWIKNNPAVVGIGLAIIFLGAAFSSVIMGNFPSLIPLLKWNPLNMIYVINQLMIPGYFSKISYLSTDQIIIANIAYMIIFSVFGYLIFKKRRV